MVVVERGNARYVVTLSVSGNLAYSHRVEPDGRLTQVSTVPTGSGPRAIAMTRNGDYAVIVNSNSDDMSVMSISGAGVLTEVDRFSSGGDNPFDVATAFGDLVVIANRDSDSVALFSIDRRGQVRQSGDSRPTGVDPHVVVIGPQGTVAVANNSSNDLTIYDLEVNENMALVDAAFEVGAPPKALAFGPGEQTLFVATPPEASIAGAGPTAEDRILAYAVRHIGMRKLKLVPAGETPCGTLITDLEVAGDLLFAAAVNPSNGRDQVRAFKRRGTTLAPAGLFEITNAFPSFKNLGSGPMRGPVDRLVFVSEFQGGQVRSIAFDRPGRP